MRSASVSLLPATVIAPIRASVSGAGAGAGAEVSAGVVNSAGALLVSAAPEDALSGSACAADRAAGRGSAPAGDGVP